MTEHEKTPPHVPTLALRGADIPLLGLGTWQSEPDDAARAVRTALDVGYRHIDTATMYGNEPNIGHVLQESGFSRDEVFLTTKLPPEHAGRERQTLSESLDNLRTDHLDLWLVHWPPNAQASPATWERFIEARDEGLVRAIGVSNYSIDQIDELIAATGEVPALNQIPWSPADYDRDVVAAHRERGVELEGYSPFKRSDLDDHQLAAIASDYGVTRHQVIVRWHIQNRIVVIPKSVTPERIASNFDVWCFDLSPDHMTVLDELGK